MTSEATKVVRRIDHIAFVVSNPQKVFNTFAEIFELPVVVPLERYEFTGALAGGLWAGDFDLWIFGATENAFIPTGIALEPVPVDDAAAELRRRGISHAGPFPPFDHGVPDEAIGRVTETVVWLNEYLGCPVWLAEYGFGSGLSREESRTHWRSVLADADGGPLRISAGTEVVVGAKDRSAAVTHWQALLDPVPPAGDTFWRIGDGPLLRLETRGDDGIDSLSLLSRDIDQAARVLVGAGLMTSRTANRIHISSEALDGMNVLVHA